MLFIPSGRSLKILFAVFGGAIFGWFWLTREEGIWILPGIFVLVAVAGWNAFRSRKVRDLLVPLTIIVSVFVVIQVGFRTVNLLVYGKFVGIEVKERNFERALGAINSVRSGGNRPFVSVTTAMRERIYLVSPAFASLKDYFDGPSWRNGRKFPAMPIKCAAMSRLAGSCGRYATQRTRRDIFRRRRMRRLFSRSSLTKFQPLARGDSWSARHKLFPKCRKPVLKISPNACHRATSLIADLLMMANPPLQFNPSSGTEAQLTPALRFLNYPVYAKSTDWVAPPTKYRLSAWYYRSGSDWMLPNIKNVDGTPAQTQVFRVSQSGYSERI